MANEKRLIDAIEHHSRVSKVQMTDLFPDWKEFPQDVQEKLTKLGKKHEQLLFEAPTVDAVEVVRCCDCVSCKVILDDVGVGHCHCKRRYGLPGVDPTDFCSYGERKDDDDGNSQRNYL